MTDLKKELFAIYDTIHNPNELYEYMRKNIRYGFISREDHQVYMRSLLNDDKLYEDTLFKSYYLQTPEELIFSKCGLCYDQVEFEKDWLLYNGYDVYTFFCTFHHHSFLIFSSGEGKKYYLIERTFKETNGIYEASSLNEAVKLYVAQQLYHNPNISIHDIQIYQYSTVNYGVGFYEFIEGVKARERYMEISL